jgi:hypothetical protein
MSAFLGMSKTDLRSWLKLNFPDEVKMRKRIKRDELKVEDLLRACAAAGDPDNLYELLESKYDFTALSSRAFVSRIRADLKKKQPVLPRRVKSSIGPSAPAVPEENAWFMRCMEKAKANQGIATYTFHSKYSKAQIQAHFKWLRDNTATVSRKLDCVDLTTELDKTEGRVRFRISSEVYRVCLSVSVVATITSALV